MRVTGDRQETGLSRRPGAAVPPSPHPAQTLDLAFTSWNQAGAGSCLLSPPCAVTAAPPVTPARRGGVCAGLRAGTGSYREVAAAPARCLSRGRPLCALLRSPRCPEDGEEPHGRRSRVLVVEVSPRWQRRLVWFNKNLKNLRPGRSAGGNTCCAPPLRTRNGDAPLPCPRDRPRGPAPAHWAVVTRRPRAGGRGAGGAERSGGGTRDRTARGARSPSPVRSGLPPGMRRSAREHGPAEPAAQRCRRPRYGLDRAWWAGGGPAEVGEGGWSAPCRGGGAL